MVVVGRRVLYKADLDMRVSDITPSTRAAVSRPVEPIRMSFLLVPQFPMLAFASAIEPLRAANRLAEATLFEWTLVTIDGRAVCASNGIEIAAQAFSAAEQPVELVLFLGMISINLAVVNFLPIPILDGGHMVFLIYEAITRRPPPAWVSAAAGYLGLAIILSLFALVFYNDINRNFLTP